MLKKLSEPERRCSNSDSGLGFPADLCFPQIFADETQIGQKAFGLGAQEGRVLYCPQTPPFFALNCEICSLSIT